jgi:hypothetical protein
MDAGLRGMRGKFCQAVKGLFGGKNGPDFSTSLAASTESVENPVDECRISEASV